MTLAPGVVRVLSIFIWVRHTCKWVFRLEIVIISTNKKSTRIMYVVICLAKKKGKSRKMGTLILLISLIRKIEAPKRKKIQWYNIFGYHCLSSRAQTCCGHPVLAPPLHGLVIRLYVFPLLFNSSSWKQIQKKRTHKILLKKEKTNISETSTEIGIHFNYTQHDF